MVKFIPLIGFLIIVIGRLFLPQPPNMFFIGLVEIVGLLILLAGVGFKLYHQKNLPSVGSVITATILIAVTLISWGVGYPDYKTVAQAEIYNRGIDRLLTRVVETKRSPRIVEFLPNVDEEIENKVAQAVELVRSGQVENAEELIAELNPKIEVFLDRWNCEPAGCTFGTNSHVWTLNPVQYYAALGIGAASLFVALLELRLISFRKQDWTFKRGNSDKK